MIDVLLIAALAVAGPLPAFATETHQFNVPVEDAPTAIRDFASQAHVQILVAGENVKETHLHSVSGEFSTEQGLRLLLADSGLSPQYIGDRSIALVKASDANPPPEGNAKEGKKSSSGRFRLAQVDQGKSSNASSVENQTSNSEDNSINPSAGLSEIIVTAQKRMERLIDVPVPVTVLSADMLLDRNEVSIQDYASTVPGLSVVKAGDSGNSPSISIRGLGTGTGLVNPTVGIVVDDVAFGGSSAQTSGSYVPDFDPSDLSSVEVLRGPQGTLYGASTLGGLIKYSTTDPSTREFVGSVTAGTEGVQHGDQAGYTFRAAANIPLNDTMALRVSGFTRDDPGYITNVNGGQRDVNDDKVSGGHLAGLWRPIEDFTLKLSALYQDTRLYGAPYIGSSLGTGVIPTGYLQQAAVPGTNWYDNKLQAYSATINAKLSIVDITSISAYNINKVDDSDDASVGFGGLGAFLLNNPAALGAAVQQHMQNKKFTQELRFSLPIGPYVTWLIGGFYDHENNAPSNDTPLSFTLSGAPVGLLANAYAPYTYQEEAAFTNVTFNITNQFDVQVGARESHITQHYAPVWTGPLVDAFFPGPSPFIPPAEDSSDNAFTYLVTPQFKFTPDWMVYARLASGYRPGGANVNTSPGIVPNYGPDKTQNYELGSKGDFLEHKLTVDASVYYINWKDIQISTISPVTHTDLFLNGTKAKSDGVELSVEAKPFEGFKASAWVALNDARLTQAVPVFGPGAIVGLDGARLPFASRISGNVTLEQSFSLSSQITGSAGGAVTYVGDRIGNFETTAERQNLPGYAQTDLFATFKYDTWKLNFFINNLMDKLAYSAGGAPTLPSVFYVIQPRTAGMSLTKKF